MVKWVATGVLVWVLSAGIAFPADFVSGSASINWKSETTRDADQKETTNTLNQNYSVRLAKDLTSQIRFRSDVGAGIQKDDAERTTDLTPRFGLDISNPYFTASGEYQINEQGLDILGASTDEPRLTDEKWTLNLTSGIEKYPKLRLFYEQERDYDHLAVREQDDRSRIYRLTADYGYRWFHFLVEHSKDVDDDLVIGSTQTSVTNDGTVDFNKTFWGGRIKTFGSYRFSDEETDREARGSDVQFQEKVPADSLTAGAWYYEALQTDPAKAPVDWNSDPGLVDSITNSRTGEGLDLANITQALNVFIKLRTTETIRKLYLWTELPSTTVNDTMYAWDVYATNDPDQAGSWTPVAASVVYNDDEHRFEFDFSAVTARYFRVVNTARDTLLSLFITEIEAYKIITQAAGTTSSSSVQRQEVDASIDIQPLDWLNMRYAFSQDQTTTDPDDDTTRQTSHDFNLRADRDLHKYLTGWVQYHTNWSYETEGERHSTDTYSLFLGTRSIQMVSSSLSTVHSINRVGSDTRSTTTSSVLHVTANLREGVDLGVDGNVSFTDNKVDDSRTSSRGVNTDLDVELTRNLRVNAQYDMTWSDSEDSGGVETSDWTTSARSDVFYRPFRKLYVNGYYGNNRDSEGTTSSNTGGALDWVLSRKIRTGVRYNYDRSSDVTTSWASNIVWNLSRRIVFRVEYQWRRDKSDTLKKTQTMNGYLTASF